MTNSQFITALKKALGGLDKTSRNDIVQEIQSHAQDSGSPLIEQFGSVEELAKQYLDGEKIAKPITSKIWGVSKKVMMAIGLLVIGLIALIAILSYFFTKDKFDYADESATELSKNTAGWLGEAWSSELDFVIDQASVVLYWHDENSLRWKCDGGSPQKLNDKSFKIRQSHCLIYLPKVATKLNIEQSQVILIKPQVSLALSTNQSSIKVSENGEKYKYEINMSRSKLEDLISHDDAKFTIQFQTKDSKISAYEY